MLVLELTTCMDPSKAALAAIRSFYPYLHGPREDPDGQQPPPPRPGQARRAGRRMPPTATSPRTWSAVSRDNSDKREKSKRRSTRHRGGRGPGDSLSDPKHDPGCRKKRTEKKARGDKLKTTRVITGGGSTSPNTWPTSVQQRHEAALESGGGRGGLAGRREEYLKKSKLPSPICGRTQATRSSVGWAPVA